MTRSNKKHDVAPAGFSSPAYRILLKRTFPGLRPVPPDDLVAPTTRKGFAYWHGKLRQGAPPLANELDPVEIASLLVDCVVFEVLGDDDFRARIVGEGIKANIESPGPSKFVSDWAEDDDKFSTGLLMVLRAVRDHKVPLGVVADHKGVARPVIVSEGILMPFVDDTGAVRRILGIVAYFDPKNSPK